MGVDSFDEFVLSLCIPDLDGLVGRTRGKILAIWGVADASYLLLMIVLL
jgi:hypothetical protein